MANLASQAVAAYLEAQGITHKVLDEDGSLRTGFKFNGGTLDQIFEFSEAGDHVTLRGFNFVDIPKDKYPIMYEVFNDLNSDYKHFKFYIDKNIEMAFVQDDDIIQLDSCGEECFELMIGMVNIVEEVYPRIMKALWA